MSRMRLTLCVWLSSFTARIPSIIFDRGEQPKRATNITKLGTVKVEWQEVCGDRSWFTSGALEAKKLTITAIQKN